MNTEFQGKNIVLIGFMGAGKTSLGKTVSKMLGIPYLDTDNLIEDAEGMTVSEIPSWRSVKTGGKLCAFCRRRPSAEGREPAAFA